MVRITTLWLLGLSVLLISCQRSAVPASPSAGKAKNIIFLIGDGMGLTQVTTAYLYGEETPSFSRFRHIGLQRNTPVGEKITDSAAGATAFSTGYKSYNAAIGVDKDTVARQTILEWAYAKGKKTGLVATSSITHATPASFFAHVKSRNLHEDIAADFLKTPVDYTAAGGYTYFEGRKDGENLLSQLSARGYMVDTTGLPDQVDAGKRHAYLLAPDALPKMSEGRGDFLPRATTQAIDYLARDKDGFFLMVEGSQIDWGGHNNDSDYVITEVLDFEKAIANALDFAEKDGNTLVVVTADHETGGLALSALPVFGRRDYGQVKPTFSTGGHTAALVPVFAYGPGAEEFAGIYNNNEIYDKMMVAFRGLQARK
ncbi:alkaline phosphatase [Neolewinella aurantiaca]|uniref:Alkaline phosphatase n=1 Tax=Neolewinella aurantiaca TaxID=2602767 RepID=A0A5C7FEL4_9BACT|nr:alkaline phosphatase [Neolewinella aurantiaca]TXF87934.1 alkaline phosphatase [Neolewinella aurantiaca]